MTTVLNVLALLPAMAPNPIDEGTLRPGLDPSQVTPGMLGFLMTLLLAVAVIFLVRDFNRRNRRLRYRAEYAERRAAEERAGGPAGTDSAGTDGADARTGADGDRAGGGPAARAEEPEGPAPRG
ncbi:MULTISPECIES: hypothetical protein [Kocuria]|jgi:hypothetical protein|uniref:hypothetical protein n=1 Tax=Kocuria TaxID=57493 RepID=UPI00035DE091|nr:MULTISPECIES: hypothetical protein [Kocuria]EYT54238.1 hypothetical protein H488_0104785 [Kocuria sp. UCD-OTCP]MEB2526408.1 hypothetical protein [Kocuria rosea]MEB2619024.1 hypothetical protein [Kocuria rosea]PWF80077.1 hypothetical protein DEJ38_14950 [Kocuria rosea]WJZ65586.1 hypothetical protein QR564_12580 [Kocuria rosea]